MAGRTVTDLELTLARALFRADKWDPARDKEQSFEWEQRRVVYIDRARRLMRTLEKDGLELSTVTPGA